MVAAAAFCSLAVVVTPAMAAEFVSSGGPSKGKGETQQINLGPFHITCKKVAATGGETTPLASPTYTTSLKFKECETEGRISGNPIFLETKFLTPFVVEYHANGFVEVGSEMEESPVATLEGGTIEIKVNYVKCVITIPEQTIPRQAEKKPGNEYTEASYSNVPYVYRKHAYNKLLISNTFTTIAFEYGEGQCSEFATSEQEKRAGHYTGEVLEQIPGVTSNTPPAQPASRASWIVRAGSREVARPRSRSFWVAWRAERFSR